MKDKGQEISEEFCLVFDSTKKEKNENFPSAFFIRPLFLRQGQNWEEILLGLFPDPKGYIKYSKVNE